MSSTSVKLYWVQTPDHLCNRSVCHMCTLGHHKLRPGVWKLVKSLSNLHVLSKETSRDTEFNFKCPVVLQFSWQEWQFLGALYDLMVHRSLINRQISPYSKHLYRWYERQPTWSCFAVTIKTVGNWTRNVNFNLYPASKMIKLIVVMLLLCSSFTSKAHELTEKEKVWSWNDSDHLLTN